MATLLDVEKGDHDGKEEVKVPLLEQNDGSDELFMVLLCTVVAICGSFAFGTCVSLLLK